MQQPPPIQWLPALESAARHLNFKKAAAELNVTPPAISQQIKVLESYLGLPLFERRGRNLRLTSAGEFYAKAASKVLKQHAQAYRDFERKFRHPVLQVSSPIFIAQELLIPHYTGFKEFAPDLELRLVTGNEFVNFEAEPLDAAIRFGSGPWDGLDCQFIQDVELKIIASPDYLSRHNLTPNSFINKESLSQHSLISIYDDIRDWKAFYPDIENADTMICDSYFSVIRAAEEGLGLAFGLLPTINRLIRSERLLVLESEPINTDYAYWLVSPEDHIHPEHIDRLYHWIKSLFDTLE